jgi:hypothetical protein
MLIASSNVVAGGFAAYESGSSLIRLPDATALAMSASLPLFRIDRSSA